MKLLVIIPAVIIVILWLASVYMRQSVKTLDRKGRMNQADDCYVWSFWLSTSAYILAIFYVIIAGAIWLAERFTHDLQDFFA